MLSARMWRAWVLLAGLASALGQRCNYRYPSAIHKSFVCLTNVCFGAGSALPSDSPLPDEAAALPRDECPHGDCCLENAFVQCQRDDNCVGFSFTFPEKTTPRIHAPQQGIRFVNGCPQETLLTRDECVSQVFEGAPPENGFAACFVSTRCPPALPAGTGSFPRCFGNAPDTCTPADWLTQGLARTSAELGAIASDEAAVTAEVMGGEMSVRFDGCFADTADRDRSIVQFMQRHPGAGHTVASCAAVCAPLPILTLELGDCHCGDVLLTPVGSRVDTSKCGRGCRAEQAHVLPPADGEPAPELPCGAPHKLAVYSLTSNAGSPPPPPPPSPKPKARTSARGHGARRPAQAHTASHGPAGTAAAAVAPAAEDAREEGSARGAADTQWEGDVEGRWRSLASVRRLPAGLALCAAAIAIAIAIAARSSGGARSAANEQLAPPTAAPERELL